MDSVPDIGPTHFARFPVLDAKAFPEFDAIAVLNTKNVIVADFHMDGAVVGQDAAVSMRAGQIVDIVATDHRTLVLGPDIDGASIHQFAKDTAAKRWGHAYLIVFHQGRRTIDVIHRVMEPYTDGTVGEILKIIVPDPAVYAHRLDQWCVRHSQPIIYKPVVVHIHFVGSRLDTNASHIILLEKAVLDHNPVRSIHDDAIRVEPRKKTVGQRDGGSLQTLQQDQALPFAVSQEMKSFQHKRTESAVLDFQEIRLAASVQVLTKGWPAKDITRKATPEAEFRPHSHTVGAIATEVQPSM